MTDSATESQAKKSIGQRLLSPIAEVRREEVASALLLTLIMFLILAAYYMLKTAREVFILGEGGAAVKSYSSAGQALLLLVLVPAYGAFASRVTRIQLVQWVTLFFASHLALFFLALSAGWQIGVPYFLWLGIFNLMVIAQFWAFASDIYTPEQGKRVFPLIGVGSSLGAWVGSVRAGQIVNTLGTNRLLVAAGVLLVICAFLARWAYLVRPRKAPAAATVTANATPEKEQPLGKQDGFAMIFGDRYLMLIAALAVILNVVNTSGEYLFGRYVVEMANATHGSGPEGAAAREAFIGSTYSQFFSTVNLVGFVLQMFVVSRVIKFLGVGTGVVHSPHGRLVRLPADAAGAVDDHHYLREGGRQQPRLLARQHHQAGAVAADQPRSEVQGQAGGRFLLRPCRRCAAGRPGLRRRSDGARRARVRDDQRGPGRRLARRSSRCSIARCASRRRRCRDYLPARVG